MTAPAILAGLGFAIGWAIVALGGSALRRVGGLIVVLLAAALFVAQLGDAVALKALALALTLQAVVVAAIGAGLAVRFAEAYGSADEAGVLRADAEADARERLEDG
jgi:hypothetical protein